MIKALDLSENVKITVMNKLLIHGGDSPNTIKQASVAMGYFAISDFDKK